MPRATLGSDTRAITSLEYGIIAGILGITLIGVFSNLSTTLGSLFSTISGSI